MKLNDDQRKIMQALLDGRNVKMKRPEGIIWYNFEMSFLDDAGDPDFEYKIEEPAIKVALFRGRSEVEIVAMTEQEQGYHGPSWERLSDWVEITPNVEE